MAQGVATGSGIGLAKDVPRVGRRAEGPPPSPPQPPFNDGPLFPLPPLDPPISNARLGMVIFLGAEMMFFVGLIGAFITFRLGSPIWPPVDQPRLPIGVTGVNTAILLFSAYWMFRALRAPRQGNQQGLAVGLLTTALLGTIFLGVQGYEWARLLHFGLTLSGGVYGATFYTLLGFHGIHVLAAVIWLLVVLVRTTRNRFSAKRHVAVQLCGMYWLFVVGLWPVLFALVYLN